MGLIKSNIRRNKIMPALVKTMFSTREKNGKDWDYWYHGKMEK
jgi:hypothetical protein